MAVLFYFFMRYFLSIKTIDVIFIIITPHLKTKTKFLVKTCFTISTKYFVYVYKVEEKHMRIEQPSQQNVMTYQTRAFIKSRKPKLRVGLFQSRTCSSVARWGRSSQSKRSSMLVGGLGRRQFLMRRKIFEKNVILDDSVFLCDAKYSVQYAFY